MKNTNDDRTLTVMQLLGNWRKRTKLSQEMNSLSDRMLADIGVHRDQIATIVEQTYPRIRFMALIKELANKWIEARNNRATALKLASFDDRMLADIGLGRSDISAISKGYYPRQRTPSLAFSGLVFTSSTNTHAINDDHRRAA